MIRASEEKGIKRCTCKTVEIKIRRIEKGRERDGKTDSDER